MNRNAFGTIIHDEYKVLLNKKCLRHSMNRIQSKDHGTGTYEINKIFLSCFDEKIYIQNNGYNGLALILTAISYRNSFFSSYKNVVLIFSLVRTAFLPSYKNIALIFSLFRTVFFHFFCFSIWKMVDREYSTDDYKSSKISIGATMKNPEILKFVLYHLKTKNICKQAVEKFSFAIRCKTQEMCNKAILENVGKLVSVPDCYKNQKLCNKAVDNYAHALEFVSDCFKTQKICNKAVNIYPSTIQFVPEYYKTQEICAKAVNTCFLYLILFLIDIRLN